MNWVEEFLARLEASTDGIMSVKIDGQTLKTKLGRDFISFFRNNHKLLLMIGKDVFRSFLLLVYEKKTEEAFLLLLSKMDAEAIILRMEQNGKALKELNDRRKEFYSKLKEFTLETLTPTLAKAIIKILI